MLRPFFHTFASSMIFHVFCDCLSASVILLNKGNRTCALCPFSWPLLTVNMAMSPYTEGVHYSLSIQHNEFRLIQDSCSDCYRRSIFSNTLTLENCPNEYFLATPLPFYYVPATTMSSTPHISNLSIYLSIYLPIYLWLYTSLLGLGRFSSFLIFYSR
jgi:hypothetical protein